jgi:hypothetical protein
MASQPQQSDGGAQPFEIDTQRFRPRALLTQSEAIEIYLFRKTDKHQSKSESSLVGNTSALSRIYCISPKAIRDIWNRRTWTQETKHLWMEGERQFIRRNSKKELKREEKTSKCSSSTTNSQENYEKSSSWIDKKQGNDISETGNESIFHKRSDGTTKYDSEVLSRAKCPTLLPQVQIMNSIKSEFKSGNVQDSNFRFNEQARAEMSTIIWPPVSSLRLQPHPTFHRPEIIPEPSVNGSNASEISLQRIDPAAASTSSGILQHSSLQLPPRPPQYLSLPLSQTAADDPFHSDWPHW